MDGFTAVDLSPQCQVLQSEQYQYDVLQQLNGASEMIGSLGAQIWRSPEEFDLSMPQTAGRLTLRWWAAAETTGIFTVREDERPLSLSLLASGLNPDADALTLQAFQQHVVRELHDTGFEPSFELTGLEQRPLLATIGLFPPNDQRDQWIFALADRCFAAAYFRKLGLA